MKSTRNEKKTMKKPENSAITITIHSKEHKKNSLNELKKVKVIEIMENIHAYSFDPSNNPLSLEDSFEMSSERQKSGDETKKNLLIDIKKGSLWDLQLERGGFV